MSNFSKFYLTKKGIDLQSKIQVGEQLKFTRVAVGEGIVDDPASLPDLTNLVEYRASYNITGLENRGDGTSVIKTIISNQDLEEGFYVREIGVFAEDPDEGEILYCVVNTGEYADYLPAKTLHAVDIMLEIITVVGNADCVIINVDDSMVYVTRKEFLHLAGDNRTTENVKKNADDILNLAIEVSILKEGIVNDFTSNIFIVNFRDLMMEEIFEGIWDKSGKRLVI